MARVSLKIRRRLALVLCLFFLLFFSLILRLFFLQVVLGDELGEKGSTQQLREIPVEAERGKIVDRNGNVLALSVSCDSVYARPTEISADKAEAIASVLSDILGEDEKSILKKITSGRSFEWIARKIDDDRAEAVQKADLDGIGLTTETKRSYPQAMLACHILGFVGVDNQGLEGIEAIRDEELSGTNGAVLARYDSHGRTIAGSSRTYRKPTCGNSLVLTIDENIQFFCERELDSVMKSSVDPKGISAIVMDPASGEILALACRPGYDPNEYRHYESALWRNTAVSDFYEPGSTAKILTMSAALEENAVSEKDTFYDRGFINVGKVKIRCWSSKPHGSETFVEVAENSCNPAFVEVGQRIDANDSLTFYRYLKSFGIGQLTGIPLPGESSGSLRAYANAADVNNVDIANMYIGQGYGVTMIQLVTAVSAAVNGGNLMEPHLVRRIIREDGEVVEEIAPKRIRRVISEKTSGRVRSVLESVVANGTGNKAYIPGYRVGGKTGTAQKFIGGSYSKSKYVASFIGIAPMNDPALVCLVVIDEPGSFPVYGGTIAAPVAKAIMEDALVYLGVESQFSVEEAEKLQKDAEKKGETADLPDLNPATAMVPSVIGLSAEEAKKALTDAGFEIRLNGSGKKVTAQTPGVLSEVKEGSTILLTLGETGECSFEIPDLSGMSLLEAEQICSALGLVFIPNGNGRCVGQSLKVGSSAVRGDIITVTFKEKTNERSTLD